MKLFPFRFLIDVDSFMFRAKKMFLCISKVAFIWLHKSIVLRQNSRRYANSTDTMQRTYTTVAFTLGFSIYEKANENRFYTDEK